MPGPLGPTMSSLGEGQGDDSPTGGVGEAAGICSPGSQAPGAPEELPSCLFRSLIMAW